MNHISILTVFILSALLALGGCAGKKTADPGLSPAPMTGASDKTTSTTDGDTTGSPTSTSSSASITSSDGTQLQSVYFDFDSFTLTTETRRALEQNAAWMRTNPTVKVTVEGHCDERGSDEYNLALGERRAMAVKNYMVTLGIAEARLGTISYGEERPVADGHDESAWAQNRRAELN